jgi:hypothetical protein
VRRVSVKDGFGRADEVGIGIGMKRRGLRLVLVSIAACAGLGGCSAHDVVKPNVDKGTGGAGGTGADGGGSGDGSDADQGVPSADCNLTGIWISKMVTVTQALSLPQFANSWFYMQVDQPAGSAEFTITNQFDCGNEVRGSVTVTLLPATLETHMAHNSQVGRKGTMTKTADGKCAVTIEPFWGLLGAADRFLPPRNTAEEIDPVAARLPLPTIDRPDGAEDWDRDGKLGLSWQVSGIIQGSRSTVQRLWTRWFTTERYAVTPSMDWGDIEVATDFDKDESIFDPTSGPLVSPSYSVRTADTPNRHLLRFLGRDKSDPRVAAVIRGTDPIGNLAATVETCHRVQDTMPAEDK